MSNLVCEHGSLRRSCEICERDERIKELERELDEARKAVRLVAEWFELERHAVTYDSDGGAHFRAKIQALTDAEAAVDAVIDAARAAGGGGDE